MGAIEKNKVWVYCGNGGDYEFERDRHYWRLWLDKNMHKLDMWAVLNR